MSGNLQIPQNTQEPIIDRTPGQMKNIMATAAWWAVLGLIVLFPAALPAAPASNTLTQVAIGNGSDYTRLAFTFKNPLESYVVRRDDVDHLVVDFGPAKVEGAPAIPYSDLISGVEFKEDEGRLTAVVQLSTIRYELRHFLSRDKYSCILDLKPVDSVQSEVVPEDGDLKPLAIPPLDDVARRMTLLIPPQPSDGPAEKLFQRFLGQLMAGNYPETGNDGRLFLSNFSNHAAAEPVSFLMAELDFLSGPPHDTYAQATEQWKAALEKWPQSVMATRARFMLASADRLTGQNNEAAAKFKILADNALHTDYVYPQLAVLRAADLLMGLGLIDEARATLDPVIKEGVADRLGLEAYARVGMADFYQGFFSQANEIFREALRLAPHLYQTYPEMLYATGEGYHYLDRPDLSRLFLMHALNLMPEHPKADVMMARIGDNYRKEARDREAMAIYGAAKRRFPDGDGGLISQVRLADMGALHSFFTQDKVFDALERGSRQATVEMYKKIVETDSASPLMQLAQLKIGTALAEDGENSEAIKWLRDIEINNPKSTLLPEALPALNQALVDEVLLREELGDWQAVADLYADNSSYLADADRPGIQRVVAKAYEKLGRFADAREIWQELEEQTPEKRLARIRSLVENSLRIGRPLDAVDYLAEMEKEFPDQREWTTAQLTQISQDLARPQDAQATNNLMHLVGSTGLEPIRKNALADAIEIEINGQRYDKASALMDQYQRDYPDDELTPEYLLTQARIEDYNKRYEKAWDKLADFRIKNPQDPRGADLLKGQIARAEELGRIDDAFRFMDLYQASYPDTPEGRSMLVRRMDREWNMGRQQDARDSQNTFRRAYPGDPAIPNLIMRQSNRDWEAGNYEQSKQGLDDMLLNYPDDPRTVNFMADRAEREWDKERYDEAWRLVGELRRFFPQDPKVGDLMLKLASADWDRGRFDAARQGWDDFRKAYPDDPRVGQSYVEQYKKSVAGGFSDEAFKLADEFRDTLPAGDGARGDLLLEEAKDYLTAGRVAEGLEKWNQFREQFPNDPRTPELLLIQARQEMKVGRQNEALDHYRQFTERYPDHIQTPDVYLETAAAEITLGRRLDAWNHLDRYRQLFPHHPGRPKALLDQAEMGRALNRPNEAVELYKIFRGDYPQSAQAPATFLPQARLEIAAGQPETAAQTLEAGVTAYPALAEDDQISALLADLYLETGQVENWATIVESALNRAPNPQANLADRFLKYNQLAQVYMELGRQEAAERNFDSALANRPPGASPEALYAIAGAYKKLLRPEKYAQTLALIRDSGDDFWKKIAEGELAALGSTGQPPS